MLKSFIGGNACKGKWKGEPSKWAESSIREGKGEKGPLGGKKIWPAGNCSTALSKVPARPMGSIPAKVAC